MSLEPVTGHYLGLDIEGQSYRVYFEEAGEGVLLVHLPASAGPHEVEKFVQRRYLAVEQSTIHNNFLSWPERTRDLVKNKGGAIRY